MHRNFYSGQTGNRKENISLPIFRNLRSDGTCVVMVDENGGEGEKGGEKGGERREGKGEEEIRKVYHKSS